MSGRLSAELRSHPVVATNHQRMESSEEHAARLADMRRRAGLSQARLAGLADCSRSSVVLIEGGYRPKRSDVIPRIEAVLEARLAEHDDI